MQQRLPPNARRLLILLLLLALPFCALRALGAMVSRKYQVDEQYWRLRSGYPDEA